MPPAEAPARLFSPARKPRASPTVASAAMPPANRPSSAFQACSRLLATPCWVPLRRVAALMFETVCTVSVLPSDADLRPNRNGCVVGATASPASDRPPEAASTGTEPRRQFSTSNRTVEPGSSTAVPVTRSASAVPRAKSAPMRTTPPGVPW